MLDSPTPRYVLGHSTAELDRLEQQGSYLRASTRALLLRAGLRPGMRVLDFGCGVGDVALLAGEIVGPSGSVLGLDRAATAIELAQARAAHLGVEHVRFVVGDELARLEPGSFDALIGRLVLIHQRDVTGVLASLTPALRAGAIVAFHEIDVDGGHWSSRPLPFLQQLWRWVDGLCTRGAMKRELAAAIDQAFDRLGIEERELLREGRVARADDPATLAWLEGFVRAIDAPVHALGLAHADDRPLAELVAAMREAGPSVHHVPVYTLLAHGRLAHIAQ